MRRKKRSKSRRPTRRVKKSAYPSPTERERIIKRRDKLLEELITISIKYPDDPRRVGQLIQKYEPQEIALVLDALHKRSATDLISDEATLRRVYRRTFARFGGNRPFLNVQEYKKLSLEYGELTAQRKSKSLFSRGPSHREQELHDLLLLGVDFWEDITPPGVPPRPADFDAPPPGSYNYPARTLLNWGWDIDERRVEDTARNETKWRPTIPELIRMVLDEGLLNGWPGKAASWASYHALHILGHLQAHEVAGQLLALLDQEGDWMSDRLPLIWSQMGPQAEPPLWGYVGDSQNDPQKRGIVFLSPGAIAGAHPERRPDTVDGLISLLQRASADDDEANAYIVYVMDRMQAAEAAKAVAEAFEQGKVDLSIIQPYDVDFLQALRSGFP